jgi:Amt family ammonium transporter
MNPVDTAYIIICSALVMFMTPGLALFYGGLTRSKNVLGTIMHSFICLGLITLVWFLWGYSLAFGPDIGSLVGSLSYVGLKGVASEPNPAIVDNLPHTVFMIFQCMFAIITVALITGSFAERIKFSAFVVFAVLWVTVVYSPLCHWVWGGGWMGDMGALDFAGGAVVHMSSGAAALAAVLVIGPRKGFGQTAYMPHNLPMTITGAAILWFGWFGFNAGSALAVDSIAANAFVTTHVAAGLAVLGWLAVETMHRGKPTTLGAASGAVAGLVAITPAAGFVSPFSALFIGFLAGVICYGGVLMKERFKYDDSLDVVGIHGLGGVWGALATGLFASTAINSGGADGLFHGNAPQLGIQLISILATLGFVFVVTWVILKLIDAVIGLRVSPDEETEGLDLSQHSETGYQI